MSEEYLTYEDICNLFKVSRRTVDRWRQQGMPFIKQGRLVRFKRADVENWFKNNNKN